jgi:hypothetical protein
VWQCDSYNSGEDMDQDSSRARKRGRIF